MIEPHRAASADMEAASKTALFPSKEFEISRAQAKPETGCVTRRHRYGTVDSVALRVLARSWHLLSIHAEIVLHLIARCWHADVECRLDAYRPPKNARNDGRERT